MKTKNLNPDGTLHPTKKRLPWRVVHPPNGGELPPAVVYPPPNRMQIQPTELARLLGPVSEKPVNAETLAEAVRVCNQNGFAVKSATIVGEQMRLELLDGTTFIGGNDA